MVKWDFREQMLPPEFKWVGWVCTYTPEEVIYAAGFQTFRLVDSSPSTKLADSYLHHNLCPYARSCLDFGLRMDNRSVKGMVIVNSCDAMRSLYHTWKRYVGQSSFVHFMNVPRVTGSLALKYFKLEIQKLMAALEGYGGRRIKESDIAEAIEIFNESRSLLRELYEMKKSGHPRLTGVLLYRILRESQRRPKQEFNRDLKRFITELKKEEVISP